MIYRCIAPAWLLKEDSSMRRVWEGEFDDARIEQLNKLGYNIYFLPNHPSHYEPGKPVDGAQIDTFRFVFVDMDLKEKKYESKEAFVRTVLESGIQPTFIVDSGGGVHAYWQVDDLDAMSYLKLSRRLMRKFHTDEAVGQIYQLMRVPGTVNTKNVDDFRLCNTIDRSEATYTCEQLDGLLPAITKEDETYCQQHYDKTYNKKEVQRIDAKVPKKFLHLVRENSEVKDIWTGKVEDRSKGDYRLGHILWAHRFSRDEAISVLVNTSKALERAPVHRISYAENIVDKIWTFESDEDGQDDWQLSSSVRDILEASDEDLTGTPFRCHKWIDDTAHGFRLGQVIGLVAGAGVGKTAVALNMFNWFAETNPDYVHFFISLEQKRGEIASRWRTMCQGDERLHNKVHILDNYDKDGSYRNLSLEDIRQYILTFQEKTGLKAGCVVIDHIGVLKKGARDGRQAIEDICHAMKAFAVSTNTMLVMQSQAPREKAGIGDIELDKDAAYGTVFFESYVDYLITLWQPLKRCYSDSKCPTVVAYKFCKIRHKKKLLDRIQEDTRYLLYFDSNSELMRELSQDEEKAFDFWNKQATNKRKQDRKTDVLPYESTRLVKQDAQGKPGNHKDAAGTAKT